MKEYYPYSRQEENYLKAIYKLSGQKKDSGVGILDLARELSLRPPTVHQMLRRLKSKRWVRFERYGKIYLTEEGIRLSLNILRRHRLWETFLHDVLKFSWEEVHNLAEYLEHIPSPELIDRLDAFLGYPAFDPHGDPIPNVHGKSRKAFTKNLSMGNPGNSYEIVAVNDGQVALLHFMNEKGLKRGSRIDFISRVEPDSMAEIRYGKKKITVGSTFLDNVMVMCTRCLSDKKCADPIPCK